MAYTPRNPNGQTTKSASEPVVIASDDDIQGKLGALTETAPSTDTASSGLNGRLQRIAQRITSVLALIPSALTSGGNFKVAIQEEVADLISSVNSSTTPLAGNAAYFGAAEDVTGYSVATVYVKSDQDSATDGLRIQLSSDGSNFDVEYDYTVSGGQVYTIPLKAKYFKLSYTNGTSAQGLFRLQTIFHKNSQDLFLKRPVDARVNTEAIAETVAFLSGYNGSTWDRLRSDITNGLDVDVTRVPSDPFGATADVAVTAGATGSISAKLRSISRDLVANIVLAAGTNAIGKLAANDGVDIGDVTINNASGGSAVNVQDGGNSLTVDGSVTVSGTVTANAGTNLNTSTLAVESGGNLATIASAVKAEDVASADADKGIPAMAVRKATPANTSSTDGDYENLQVSGGRLWASSNIDQIAGTTPDTNSGTKSAGTLRVVLATDQPALTNKLLVTPDSVALPANQSVNTNQIAGTAVDVNSGNKSAGTQRIVIATDQPTLTNAIPISAASLPTHGVAGDVAHGATDSGNPVKVGYRAVAHSANPTAVTAGQRSDALCNRAGIPFTIGGHPNVVTIEAAFTGAQTDTALVTISTGLKIVVTQVQVLTDNANTAFPQCRIGFGTANTPTTTGVVLTHPGLPAGGGVSRGDGSGILGIGADNEDLRITCAAPTGGSLRALVTYFTIES